MDETVWCPPNILRKRRLTFKDKENLNHAPMFRREMVVSKSTRFNSSPVEMNEWDKVALLFSFFFLSRLGSHKAFLSSILTNSSIVHVLSPMYSLVELKITLVQNEKFIFFARDKYWLFTSCQDGTDPSRLEQQQKHLPYVRMDRVASSILNPKFFWKKTTIEGCYADECSVLRREAEQFIYCRWFCN